MGTRGVFGVHYDQRDKLAYNHFDSYPEGLGDELTAQLRAEIDTRGLPRALSGWRRRASAMRLVTERSTPTEEDIALCVAAGTVDLGVGDQCTNDWYCLLRGAQGDLLKLLEVGIMLDSSNFINDSLFCEWGYVLNLDAEVLEVYEGGQHAPHTNGRYSQNSPDGGYYPCALVLEVPLANLPDGGISPLLQKGDE